MSRTHTIRRAISKIMAYDSLPQEEKWGEWMMIAQMVHNGSPEELIEWADRLKQHMTPINMKVVPIETERWPDSYFVTPDEGSEPPVS